MDPMTISRGFWEEKLQLLDGEMVGVRVANSGGAVRDWILQHFAEEVQFGFDVEWRPERNGEHNAAAILQLAGSRGCLIIRLKNIDPIPKELVDFLANENVKLAGVGVNGDCEKLREDYKLKCRGAVELTKYAADVLDNKVLEKAGLARLCKEILGLDLNKDARIRQSDWEASPLCLEQIIYAANDAYVGYKLLVNLDKRKAYLHPVVGMLKLVNSDGKKASQIREYWERNLQLVDGNMVRVRVAYTDYAVSEWILQHSAEDRFGIDIEWRHKRKEEHNDAAILQLADSRGCLIVQLKYVPEVLKDFLADENIKLAGVRVKRDFEKLREDLDSECQGAVELRTYAADVLDNKHLKRAGLARLCRTFFGLHLKEDEKIGRSDWEAWSSSLEHITYVPNNAYLAYKLLVTLDERNADKIRGYWEGNLQLLDGKMVGVRVAYTGHAIKDWIRRYSVKEVQFGIDLKWRRKRKAAILQLACSRGCLIAQLKYIDHIPRTLKKFLANKDVELAGVRVDEDCEKLWEDFDLMSRRRVDLTKYAADVLRNKSLKHAGLARLCKTILGLHLQKDEKIRLQNWEAWQLSSEQITYAANKAYIAYKLLLNLAEQDKSFYSSDSSSSS